MYKYGEPFRLARSLPGRRFIIISRSDLFVSAYRSRFHRFKNDGVIGQSQVRLTYPRLLPRC